MDLRVVSTHLDDGSVELTLCGEIDLSNAHQIRDAVTAMLAGNAPRRIRCDLRLVSLIDSVGIGQLVGCWHAAKACGVEFTLLNPRTVVYRQLWVSGLIGLFGSPVPLASRSEATPA